MIAHSIPQAAQRVGRSEDTIRQWIRAGLLTAVRNDIDGQRYVSDDQLVDVERTMRQRQAATRRIAAPRVSPEVLAPDLREPITSPSSETCPQGTAPAIGG